MACWFCCLCSFTLACHLHHHSQPPTHQTPTPCSCFNLHLPVFICACLVLVTVVVAAVTHSQYLSDKVACLLVMYLPLLLLATTANRIVSIEDTVHFGCSQMLHAWLLYAMDTVSGFRSAYRSLRDK